MKKYNEECAIELIKNTQYKTVASIVRALNLCERSGTNYEHIYNTVKKYNLDTSHWLGQSHAKGLKLERKVLIEDYFNNKNGISSHALKLRLLEDGIKEEKCESCMGTKWLDKKIPLELHHIDGNSKNNNLENLKILCPNCHSLTANFRAKKKSSHSKKKCFVSENDIVEQIKKCENVSQVLKALDLRPKGANYKRVQVIKQKYNLNFVESNNVEIVADVNWRSQPRIYTRKVERPSKEELIELVKIKPIVQIAKQFNLKSSNSIYRWCKNYDIDYKSLSPFILKK